MAERILHLEIKKKFKNREEINSCLALLQPPLEDYDEDREVTISKKILKSLTNTITVYLFVYFFKKNLGLLSIMFLAIFNISCVSFIFIGEKTEIAMVILPFLLQQKGRSGPSDFIEFRFCKSCFIFYKPF